MQPGERFEERIGEGLLDITVIAPRIQGDRGADRGFIAGRSGAGKSYLAERLLRSYNNSYDWPKEFRGLVVIIDVNDTFRFPVERTYNTVASLKLNPKYRAIKYVPDIDQLSSEHWNALWKELFYYKGPLLVYVDETRAMEPVFGKRFPEGNWLLAYLTRGRARKKAAILGAQRPVLIPRDIIGQAEWYYVFDLPIEDDRITMAGTIGQVSQDGERIRDLEALHRFEFWFKGPDLRKPVKASIV